MFWFSELTVSGVEVLACFGFSGAWSHQRPLKMNIAGCNNQKFFGIASVLLHCWQPARVYTEMHCSVWNIFYFAIQFY